MVAIAPEPIPDTAAFSRQRTRAYTLGTYSAATETRTITYNLAQGVRISRDPIGEDGGINLYGYVANDPIRWTDPLGLAPVPRLSGPWNAPFAINGPLSALGHFFLGMGSPATLGPGLTNSLSNLQKIHPFPNTNNCPKDRGNMVNMAARNGYWSWNDLSDSINVGFSLGQFGYLNDGTTTSISDTYAFPTISPNWSTGGTDFHNTLLSPLSLLGNPYNVSGSYPTP